MRDRIFAALVLSLSKDEGIATLATFAPHASTRSA
jgi:hypothetical protein